MTGLKPEDIIDPDQAKKLILNPDTPLEERLGAFRWINRKDAETQDAIFRFATGPLEPGRWHDKLLVLASGMDWTDTTKRREIVAALRHGATAILDEHRWQDAEQSRDLLAILRQSLRLGPHPLSGATINPLLPFLRSPCQGAQRGAAIGISYASIPMPAETETIDPAIYAELARLAEDLLIPMDVYDKQAVDGIYPFLAAALLDAPTIGHINPERIGNACADGLERTSTELSAFLQDWIRQGVAESRRAKLAALAASFEAARPVFRIPPLKGSVSFFFGKLE